MRSNRAKFPAIKEVSYPLKFSELGKAETLSLPSPQNCIMKPLVSLVSFAVVAVVFAEQAD